MEEVVKSLPMVIHVDKDKCVNCHACISVCPVKTCNDGSGAYVNLQANSCIACGRCLAACSHGARYFTDDFAFFLEAVARQEKMIAVVAPSVVSNFPDQYLRLNGWLKSLGLIAIFDVSFGAELCAKTYADYIRRHSPQLVIAQPCPAIVTYIQVHHPELLPYLAPVDSPMLHTMKMARRFFPRYADHKIVVISPCPAKKREHVETGYGDYSVTYSSINEHLRSTGTDLGRFPEVGYETPTPDTAVLFPEPRGLMRTVERWLPGVGEQTRTIEGQDAVYSYLASLSEMIRKHPATVPLLVDCLSCRHGCNCGPAALASDEEIDAVEYRTNQRHRDLQEQKLAEIGNRALEIERLLRDYWQEGIYTRQYADLSANSGVRRPSPEEQKAILASMHKYSKQDEYNCCSCGYGSCLDMTVAIYNGLNRPENCHHYLAKEREIAQQQLTEYRDHLERLIEDRTADLKVANRGLQQEIVMRRQVEQELQDSKRELRDVLQGSPIPQFVIDKNHKVLYWNTAIEQLTGLAADEVIGTSNHWRAFYEAQRDCLADLLVDGRKSAVAARYRDKCKESTLLDGAYEGLDLFTTGGKQKWLYFTAAAIEDAKGNIIGAIETIEDVTARRLTEIELARSQQAAEAANRAKSAFLANMSHEIRTPMTAIMGYLDLLSEESAKGNLPAHSGIGNPLSVISQNADHLLRLIDDILDLSKIEAGKMDVEKASCSLCRIVADVLSLMRARAVAKGLSLDVEYATAIPESIRTDPRRLRQILINILGNAVKFTSAGGVRLVIGLEGQPKSPMLLIRVVDSGIGMSQETLQGLFQPFTQADVSTSRRFGGTGLGLTISQRLANLLGGDIRVESAVGKGSTFTISLPTGCLDRVKMIESPAELPSLATEERTPDTASNPALLAGRRVLLAEDGIDNQRLIALLVKRLGADVEVAENGQSAVEMTMAARDTGQPFDLILMDMQMPILDGYQATKRLRAKAWRGPIVALTAHAMTDDRQKCLDCGCNDYLTKPLDRGRFRQMLVQYIGPSVARPDLLQPTGFSEFT
jgi:PAS domain S-box-containing protein